MIRGRNRRWALFLVLLMLITYLDLSAVAFAKEEETSKKEINISRVLVGDTGGGEFLEDKIKKEYINAVIETSVSLDQALQLDDYIKKDLTSENYSYVFDHLVIVTNDDLEKKVDSSDYEKTIGEIASLNGVNFFTDIKEIKVAYNGEAKPREEVVTVNLVARDQLHGEELNKKESFKLSYKGELVEDPFSLETSIEAGSLIVKIKTKPDISSNKESLVFKYDNYSIVEGSLKELDLTGLNRNYELALRPKISSLDSLVLKNIHNNDKFPSRNFFYKDKTIYFGKADDESSINVSDLVDLKITNRQNTEGYEDKEIYYRDRAELTITSENLDEFIKRVAGEGFEYDSYINGLKEKKDLRETFIAGSPSTKTHNIDFLRKNYRIKINDGEEKTYNVMGDTDYLIFNQDEIESVSLNNGGENLKGQKISIKDMDLITIKTKEGKDLREVSYKVQNRVYGSKAKLYEPREFIGLEGTQLIVRPITQNSYKDGDTVKIDNSYVLADSKEKEIIVSDKLETPFYFNIEGKVAYRYMYITKYGDNWNQDLEDSDYDIINLKDENGQDYELLVLYKSDVLIGDKNIDPEIEAKDYSDNNLELIELEENIVLEGEEVRKLNMPGSEEFSRIEFVSGPVKKLDKDTLYIYSYRELVKDDKSSDVKIPIRIEFDEDPLSTGQEELSFPRLDEDYEVLIPIPQGYSCYSDVTVNPGYLERLEGIDNVVVDSKEIRFTVKAKEKDELKDLFPKLPKKAELPRDEAGLARIMRSFKGFINRGLEEGELDYLLIKFTNKSGGCVPKLENFFKKLNIQRAYYDGDELKNISGDWNIEKVVAMAGTEIKLDLNLGLDEESLKKEVTMDESKKTYRFVAYKEGLDRSALVDENGARVKVSIKDENGVEVDKILGVETERLNTNSLGEDTETYYLIYKPIDKPKEETKSYDYTNRYYYLEYPSDLIESYGDLNIDKSYDIEKYYREFEELLGDYYNWDKRVGDLEKDLLAYIEENPREESLKTLGSILEILNNNLKPVKELVGRIEEMIKTLSAKPPIGGKILTREELVKEAEDLNLSLEAYIKREGAGRFKLRSYSKDQYFKLDKDRIKIAYRDSNVDKANGSKTITEAFNEDYEYKGYEYRDYSRIPLSISKDYMGHKEIMDEFIALDDSSKGFDLKNYTRWNEKYKDSKEVIAYDENIDNINPIIYTERVYKELKLSKIEKPDSKPPVETGKNLDIIIRRVEVKEDGERKVLEIFNELHYRDLPKYIKSLGWTINSYENLEYLDDSGQTPALKEGDVKFSEKLEDGKSKTMYIDYVGDGYIPEFEMADYLVLYSEIYRDENGQEKTKPIEGVDNYEGQAAVGQTVRISPLNLENMGLKQSDEKGNILEGYEDISKLIEKGLNIINVYYRRQESIGYDVEYLDEDGKKLTEDKLNNHLIIDGRKLEEKAKDIPKYKALKGQEEFLLKDEEKSGKLFKKLEFSPEEGYEIKEEENIQRLYKDNVKVMELEKLVRKAEDKEDKYVIKFIYRDAITLTLDANGGGFKDDETIKKYNIFKGQIVDEDNLDKASRTKYRFLGWYGKDEKGNLKEEKFDFTKPINESITLYAKWKKKPSGGGETTPEEKPETKPDIDGWYEPSRPEEKPEEEKLNKLDHFAYIKGYPDINVRPEGNITREEVATVFYRLLTDRYRASVLSETNKFPDVDGKRWSNKEISTMANANIIKGYEDGSFRPREEITRAEVAAIAVRFDKLESGQKSFSDIEGHWAEKYIRSAAEKGWVKGYEDNSFRPNKKMTRAEFVTLVNGVLERKVREENILEGIKHFKDLKRTAWYYEAMVEATNSHIYEEKRLEDGSEVWLEIIEDRNY